MMLEITKEMGHFHTCSADKDRAARILDIIGRAERVLDRLALLEEGTSAPLFAVHFSVCTRADRVATVLEGLAAFVRQSTL